MRGVPVEMGSSTVFYFWEPPGAMPAYLRLCRSTWDSSLSGYEKTHIDLANLIDYIDPEVYNLDFLRRLAPNVQKDAIEVAVLKKHGGVFMDVDTIAVADISPILGRLTHSEMLLFGRHLAFVAARPGARLIKLWLESTQQRLELASKAALEPSELPWDFAGNAPLADVLDAITGVGSPEPPTASGTKKRNTTAERLRRRVLLASRHRRELTTLNRRRHGFIAEATIFANARSDPQERYRRFWFESDVATESVFSSKTTVIGLHHSWTPDWYTGLSTDEVLDHDCLLSRVLRRVISGR